MDEKYSVGALARLSGVSTRTLRYYDSTGLLCPVRDTKSGYRLYGVSEVDRLQRILIYRELGMNLESISTALEGEDTLVSLTRHLSKLNAERERIGLLIKNVEKTIGVLKGENVMNDNEKFEGFKRETVEANEKKYGKEVRERFGDEMADAANEKFYGMTEAEWTDVEAVRKEYERLLSVAVGNGDPSCADAQNACRLHGRWLELLWPEGAYSKQSQLALTQGYTQDERFKAYYDKLAPGSADFLYEAAKIYCK